jgi:hypothetical protein
MHCKACDTLLNDFEATRRNKFTHDFVDLCNRCFDDIKGTVPVIERKDLMTSRDYDDDLSTEGTEDVLYNNYRVHRSIEDINDINH